LAAAAGELRRRSRPDAIDLFEADLSSQAQVRRVADEVRERYPRLDVLVNNVGGFWAHRHVTADGLELTFALNHLAPFLLTSLLVERMREQEHARIVTVTSSAEALGTIDFDDLQGSRKYSGQRAYNQSKLADVLFTFELARRLRGTGVTVNAVHPGVTRTAFGAEDQMRFFEATEASRDRSCAPPNVARTQSSGRPRHPSSTASPVGTSTIADRSGRPSARSTRRRRSASGRSARS
jgi:NAD(P)-dependent dehydrogenase (short-subunit alcohol dehydrogenase family)